MERLERNQREAEFIELNRQVLEEQAARFQGDNDDDDDEDDEGKKIY